MHEEYEVWFLTGVHRGIKCVDCHLPNNNEVNHLIWKGIDGTKDVVSFFSGVYPDHITATGHAKKVIKANCMRCHNEMVSRISTDGQGLLVLPPARSIISSTNSAIPRSITGE